MANFLLSSICAIFIIRVALGQIQYQEMELSDKRKANANGRLPLYAPTRCKEHELLYPGDQANDWICDCAPAAIYHPESDKCHLAFRRGPCEENEFLVLGVNKIIPECIPNACKIDGQIQINKVCYTFGEAGPCPNAHLSFVLGVDPATLFVDCVKLSIHLQTRFAGVDEPEYDLNMAEKCARGSKLAFEGKCPTVNATAPL